MKIALTAFCALLLAGCAAQPGSIQLLQPSTAPLRPCLAQPVPLAGQTNESLAQGFLAGRKGLSICQGVVRAFIEAQDDQEADQENPQANQKGQKAQ